MMLGSNILNQALRLIGKQTIQYYAFNSRSTNDIGYDVSEYADPVDAKGSFQPIPRNLYQQMGLDFQRNYANVFLPQSMVDVERDVSGDKVGFNGKIYQCLSATPWAAIDGWTEMLVVQVQ